MNRLLAGAAAGYAGIGLASLVRPAMVPALFGGSAPTAASRTEIRAVYGGLPLAVAAGLAAAPVAAAVPAAVISAGMAAGRIAGATLEPERPAPVTVLFTAIELALAAACFAGARRLAGDR